MTKGIEREPRQNEGEQQEAHSVVDHYESAKEQLSEDGSRTTTRIFVTSGYSVIRTTPKGDIFPGFEAQSVPFDDLRAIVKPGGRKSHREMRWGSDSEGWDEFFKKEQQRVESKTGKPLEDLDLYVRTYFTLLRLGIKTVDGLVEILGSRKVPKGIGLDGLNDIQNKLEKGSSCDFS